MRNSNTWTHKADGAGAVSGARTSPFKTMPSRFRTSVPLLRLDIRFKNCVLYVDTSRVCTFVRGRDVSRVLQPRYVSPASLSHAWMNARASFSIPSVKLKATQQGMRWRERLYDQVCLHERVPPDGKQTGTKWSALQRICIRSRKFRNIQHSSTRMLSFMYIKMDNLLQL